MLWNNWVDTQITPRCSVAASGALQVALFMGYVDRAEEEEHSNRYVDSKEILRTPRKD